MVASAVLSNFVSEGFPESYDQNPFIPTDNFLPTDNTIQHEHKRNTARHIVVNEMAAVSQTIFS